MKSKDNDLSIADFPGTDERKDEKLMISVKKEDTYLLFAF